MRPLFAPFPYFGGKRSIADRIWAALGQPAHYIEPFFGSGAVLLARPDYDPRQHVETVCDANGYVCNAWRAIRAEPDTVAYYCDWPVNHTDLNARRRLLRECGAELVHRLEADPTWYDPVLAGYWVWGTCCGIGTWLDRPRAMPAVTDGGKGILARTLRASSPAVVDGQLRYTPAIYEWLRRLAVRLRYVQVVCGDWTRVCGGAWQTRLGTVGLFVDPPYGVRDRDGQVYGRHDSKTLAHDVRAWCLERGADPHYRIVLCGYEEHEPELLAAGWTVEWWTARGGYANQRRRKLNTNRLRERLYYSPHCLTQRLF